MSFLKLKHNVPEVYVSESRDFQVLLHSLDLAQNAVMYDAKSILCSLDSMNCHEGIEDRLASKVGLFSDTSGWDATKFRYILSAFPYLKRYKGSKIGIEGCVNAFARSQTGILKYNINWDTPYEIHIRFNKNLDTDMLIEVLSYVVPTGYKIVIEYESNMSS